VTATNAAGIGPASTPSNSVAPNINVPGAPLNVSAVAGPGQATVSFTAPVSNGGSTITSYILTSTPGNIIATGSAGPITVTGLTPGASYSFIVFAVNANGYGQVSALSNSVTLPMPPAVPALGAWGLLTAMGGLALFLGFRRKRL
jgi:hypothetical protein